MGGFWFGVQGLGLDVQGFGFRVRVSGLESRAQGTWLGRKTVVPTNSVCLLRKGSLRKVLVSVLGPLMFET